MPLPLLQRLAVSSLPCQMTDADDIEKLAVLVAAGLVAAHFAGWRTMAQAHSATVMALTPAGTLLLLAAQRVVAAPALVQG